MAFTLSALDYTLGSPSYTAQQDRLMMLGMAGSEGVRFAPSATTGELAVTTTGSGNASVNISPGHILIAGASGQGAYYAYNDAASTVGPLAANSSGNPRIDVIVARVTDSATPSVVFAVLQGTPAASPTAPAVTKTTTTIEVALAQVLVQNTFTITTVVGTLSTITDVRPRAFVDAAAVSQTTAATIATAIPSPQIGQMVVDGNGYLRRYDGTTWQIMLASGTYTPTIAPTVVGTGGTNTAWWVYANAGAAGAPGMLMMAHNLTFGTAGQTFPTATASIALPTGFTANATTFYSVGTANLTAAATGFFGNMELVGTTAIRPYVLTYNGAAAGIAYVTPTPWAAAVPATWTSNDFLRYSVTIPGTFAI